MAVSHSKGTRVNSKVVFPHRQFVEATNTNVWRLAPVWTWERQPYELEKSRFTPRLDALPVFLNSSFLGLGIFLIYKSVKKNLLLLTLKFNSFCRILYYYKQKNKIFKIKTEKYVKMSSGAVIVTRLHALTHTYKRAHVLTSVYITTTLKLQRTSQVGLPQSLPAWYLVSP